MRVTFTSRLLAALTFASQLKPESGNGSQKHYYPYGMLLEGNRLLAGATPTGTQTEIVEEDIQYTNISNAYVDGYNDLIIDNTTSGQGWNSGASSVQTVEDGEYVEFEVEDVPLTQHRTFIGLTYQDNSTAYNDAEYAIFFYNSGSTSVWVNGISQMSTSKAVGDVFSIHREGGNIVFKRNGVTIYPVGSNTVVDSNPTAPMYVDVAMLPEGNAYKAYNVIVGKWKTSNVYASSDYVPSHGSVSDYRYGFQGQEKDDEVKGEGNSLNYKYRMHDPRIGRFFAVDPLAGVYPFWTPYAFSGNQILHKVELEGLEPEQPWMMVYWQRVIDVKDIKLMSIKFQIESLKENAGLERKALVDQYQILTDERNHAVQEWTVWYSDWVIEVDAWCDNVDLANDLVNVYNWAIDIITLGESALGRQAVKQGLKRIGAKTAAELTEMGIQQKATKELFKQQMAQHLAKGKIAQRVIAASNEPVQNISLGLKNGDMLKNFSKKFTNAPYMDEWAVKGLYNEGVQSFDIAFKQATEKVLSSGGKIKFNLTNFDIGKAMKSSGKGLYDDGVGYTDWEFNQILSNKELLNSTEFYREGIRISTEKVLKEAGL